jgi:hypothetical protein
MKRFLPVAVIVALVGATVAVVVISGGDNEGGLGPKQPSVEQQVSAADELPPKLRELRRKLADLDQVRSVECGAGRQAPVHLRLPLVQLAQLRGAGVTVDSLTRSRRATTRPVTGKICQIGFRDGTVALSAEIGGSWVEIAPRAPVVHLDG